MEQVLDRTLVYETMTPEDECWWRFEYRAQGGHGDTKWAWQAFRKRPGRDHYVPQGEMSELEVLRRMVRTGSHQLDENDREDLLFWLYLGGFQEFLDLESSKKE